LALKAFSCTLGLRPLGSSVRPGRMLAGSDDGAIGKVDCPINLASDIGLQGQRDPLGDAHLRPEVEATGYNAARAITFRQIPLRCPEGRIHSALLRMQCWLVAGRRTLRSWGQQQRKPCPVFVRQVRFGALKPVVYRRGCNVQTYPRVTYFTSETPPFSVPSISSQITSIS